VPSEFGMLDIDKQAADDAVIANATVVEQLIYRRLNALSEALFDPASSINTAVAAFSKMDEVLKQFSMIGRQIGNLQLQIGTLVHNQNLRREEDEANWKLIRVQVSGIRGDVQKLELAFDTMKGDLNGRVEALEQDVVELFDHQSRTNAELAELKAKLEGKPD
jgi:hypothetical protein